MEKNKLKSEKISWAWKFEFTSSSGSFATRSLLEMKNIKRLRYMKLNCLQKNVEHPERLTYFGYCEFDEKVSLRYLQRNIHYRGDFKKCLVRNREEIVHNLLGNYLLEVGNWKRVKKMKQQVFMVQKNSKEILEEKWKKYLVSLQKRFNIKIS